MTYNILWIRSQSNRGAFGMFPRKAVGHDMSIRNSSLYMVRDDTSMAPNRTYQGSETVVFNLVVFCLFAPLLDSSFRPG